MGKSDVETLVEMGYAAQSPVRRPAAVDELTFHRRGGAAGGRDRLRFPRNRVEKAIRRTGGKGLQPAMDWWDPRGHGGGMMTSHC